MVGSTGLTILKTGFSQYIHNIYIYALCVYVIYIYTLCVYTVYTIHCRKACTKLELIEQQLLPRDEQGSSTNIHHYSLFGKYVNTILYRR